MLFKVHNKYFAWQHFSHSKIRNVS